MPTEAEYEKTIADLRGQLTAVKQQLDTVNQQVSHATTEKESLEKSFKEKLLEHETAVRKRVELEAKAHAVDPEFKVESMSNEAIDAYLQGFEKAKKDNTPAKAHGTSAPPIPNQTATGSSKSKNRADDLLNF